MKKIIFFAAMILMWSFVVPSILPVFAEKGAAAVEAVEGTVKGKVQKVGFRAFIFRQAIQYDLGGMIENLPDGSVHFVLQGSPDVIDRALEVIRKGPTAAEVTGMETKPADVLPDMTTVTVKGWTSESRDFQEPEDLVYFLRGDGSAVSEEAAHRIYKSIIRDAMLKQQEGGARDR